MESFTVGTILLKRSYKDLYCRTLYYSSVVVLRNEQTTDNLRNKNYLVIYRQMNLSFHTFVKIYNPTFKLSFAVSSIDASSNFRSNFAEYYFKLKPTTTPRTHTLKKFWKQTSCRVYNFFIAPLLSKQHCGSIEKIKRGRRIYTLWKAPIWI